MRFVLLFAIAGSIALLVSRVHQRLWVRATMRNLLALQVWILIAVVASFSLFSLMYAEMEWSALRVAVMSYVFACGGICLPRVALDLLREMGFEARHRKSNSGSGSYGPVAVFGAGDLGALFLEHLKSSDQSFYPGLRVVGFLDESRILWGRHLRAFKIIGGLSSVAKLVKSDGLKGIVVAVNEPRQELLDQLDALAAEHNLRIYRWRVGLDEGA
jgi:FlaA1/EpsC-like NDP-sugar epimerase